MKLSSLLLTVVSFRAHSQFDNPARDSAFGEEKKTVTYRFPFNPGQPNQLAGTMGELRSNHFHAGIDIRTQNRVGLPILAAAEGYVSRVTSSAFGYGNVLYIAHPNGQTTVYGHLDQFKGAIAKHVLEKQYERKSFEIDLTPERGAFKVNAGDTIGLSGNTGGSNGPHLHFEIRNEKNEAINPLRFGFKEINDNRAPIAQKIALRTLDARARINDRFGRFEFYLVREGNGYVLSQPILAHGRIAVELLAHDKVDAAHFRCGINHIELRANEQKVFEQKIETINFQTTRQILAVMDYKTLKSKGTRFNKLYVDDGNALPFYDPSLTGGVVTVGAEPVYFKATLTDAAGNQSRVSFRLKPTPPTKQVNTLEPMANAMETDVINNTLIVSVKPTPGDTARTITLYEKGSMHTAHAAYYSAQRQVFLIDLRKHLPDSVAAPHASVATHFAGLVPPGLAYTFYSDWAEISFRPNSLYDTLYLPLAKRTSEAAEVFTVGTSLSPLQSEVKVKLKTERSYGPKAAVYLGSGAYEYRGGTFENGYVTFDTRDWGNFTILEDSIPPTVYRIRCTPASARFRIRDNLSGIAKYEANINGEWLLMSYDYKTGIVQSQRKDKRPLKGEFILRVTDRAGNTNTYQQQIP
ncbi:MAG: M23 family metallopeptidase [Cyclobacteriaceae bacterium]|nr:M23 family metallopeptidase [Cyclobacteriaceae bacterium]